MFTNEELALLVQWGDREAAGMLWEQVRRLVLKLMSRHYQICQSFNIDPEDLNQEGYFAVLQAARAYSPNKPYLFTSYLSLHIGNAAKEALGLRCHKTRPQNVRSLDEPLPGTEDESFTLGDTITDPDAEAAFEEVQDGWQLDQLRACLNDCMADMPPNQVDALRARYFEGKTLKAIAGEKGCNPEWIRQLEAKGLRTLRHPRYSQRLRPFLDESIRAYAHKGTGLQAFRERQGSAVELLFERLERYTLAEFSAVADSREKF